MVMAVESHKDVSHRQYRRFGWLVVALITSLAACAQRDDSGGNNTRHFATDKHAITVETLVDGLSQPWGLAFLPDGSMLITEKTGSLRRLSEGRLSAPIAGLPQVKVIGQGGLLDIAVDPDFSQNRRVYFSYAEPSADGDEAGTAVARARLLLTPTPHLAGVEVIFTQHPKSDAGQHFGSRLVFAPDGRLFVTLGDRGDSARAQDPFDYAGSVLRINADGSVPSDNPFANGQKAAPEIWSIGHRNVQGATWHRETHSLWTLEHGARGGDELNHPRAGRNYGWPVISYGRHYSGLKIGEGTHKAGMEQPVYYWDPSIAPSGLAFYDGDAFHHWRGNLFAGALKDQLLVRLELQGERVVHEERLVEGEYGRVRDVRQGPDGFLYLLIDASNGKLLRIRPTL